MTASFKESFSPEESSLSSKFLYKETTHTEPNEKNIYICTFEELQKQYSRKITLKIIKCMKCQQIQDDDCDSRKILMG